MVFLCKKIPTIQHICWSLIVQTLKQTVSFKMLILRKLHYCHFCCDGHWEIIHSIKVVRMENQFKYQMLAISNIDDSIHLLILTQVSIRIWYYNYSLNQCKFRPLPVRECDYCIHVPYWRLVPSFFLPQSHTMVEFVPHCSHIPGGQYLPRFLTREFILEIFLASSRVNTCKHS